jgi:MHS family alpha-ketoglutarate permease-like MFS transporter
MAWKKHRGFWSSFNYVTLIGGQLVALAVLIVVRLSLGEAALAAWGWRIPFAVGAVLAIAAYFQRRRMEESTSYLKAKATGAAKPSTWHLISKHPRETLTILGLTSGGSMIFYVYTTYMQKFLTNTSGFSKDQATELSAASPVVFMLAQPLFGWVSDKVGRKTMLLVAFGGGALVTWPVMTMIGATHSAWEALGLIALAMLVQSGYTSISAVVKAELFPTHVRTLGVALPYAIANAAFGGTAEYVALWFKSEGVESGFFIYASVLLAIGFLVALSMRDTQAHSRIVED